MTGTGLILAMLPRLMTGSDADTALNLQSHTRLFIIIIMADIILLLPVVLQELS